MIFYNQCGNVDSIRLYYGPNNNDPSLWRTFEYIGGSYDQNKTTNIINQISNVVSINKYDNHTYEYDTLGNITKETIEEKIKCVERAFDLNDNHKKMMENQICYNIFCIFAVTNVRIKNYSHDREKVRKWQS